MYIQMNLLTKINHTSTILKKHLNYWTVQVVNGPKLAVLLISVSYSPTLQTTWQQNKMLITLLLVSSSDTFRTLQASSSALNWLKYKTKGHKHVTVSSKNSLDARPHEGTLAHFYEAQRNKFVTTHHNVHIQQRRKVDTSLFFMMESHKGCIKGLPLKTIKNALKISSSRKHW